MYGKQVIPRFEHDEHQAFYDAAVFLRNEENNYEEVKEDDENVKEKESEYQLDWQFHNKHEKLLEPWTKGKHPFDKDEIEEWKTWIENEQKNNAMKEDPSIWKPDDLNKKQRFVYNLVEQHWNKIEKKPLRLAFYGRPGTGKSVIIHCLKTLLGDKCTIAAATGSAGYNVGGQTIHSLLAISVGAQRKFSNMELIRHQEKWKTIDYLIIDEISLVSQTLLSRIDAHLKLFRTNHNDEPFECISTVSFANFFKNVNFEQRKIF